jgi:hypothetical protein
MGRDVGRRRDPVYIYSNSKLAVSAAVLPAFNSAKKSSNYSKIMIRNGRELAVFNHASGRIGNEVRPLEALSKARTNLEWF